jgi:hypothetical protein
MDVRMPDGTVIANVPDGVTQSELMSRYSAHQEKAAPQEEPSMLDQLKRQGGLAVRHGVEGLASLPAAFVDPFQALAGQQTFSEGVSHGLDRAGVPRAESDLEKLVGAPSRAVAGAMGGAGLGGLIPQGGTAANAIRQGLTANMGRVAPAAAAGGLGAEVTRQAGGGPGSQFTAAVLASFLPGGFATAANKTIGTGKELLRPLTNSGQDQLASDALARLATDRTKAMTNLQGAQQLVPGSAPTAAQAADDLGIMSAERAMRRTNPAPFAERGIEQNGARLAQLRKLEATQARVDVYEAAREKMTGPMREQSFNNATGPVDFGPVADKIVTLGRSPEGGRAESQKALKWIADRVGTYLAEGRTDPRNAYELQKDIGSLVAGKVVDTQGAPVRLAGGLANDVKNTLSDQIETVAPGFRQYLSTYSKLSGPIDKLQAVRDRLGDDLSKVTNAAPSGSEYTLSQAKMRNANTDLKDLGLTQRQNKILGSVQADLDRATNAEQAVRVPGSDTMQNLSAANLVSRVLGDRVGGSQVVQNLISRPLAFAYKPAEARIQEKLVEGLLDPQKAAAMLKKARQAGKPLTLEDLLSSRVSPALYGGLLGSR